MTVVCTLTVAFICTFSADNTCSKVTTLEGVVLKTGADYYVVDFSKEAIKYDLTSHRKPVVIDKK